MTVTKAKLGKEDVNYYDGLSRTFSRVDSTGGALTINKVGNTVDVLSVYGGGTSLTRTTIADAITKVGSSNVVFDFAPGTWTIDDDLTIPDTIGVLINAGTVFSIDSGKTLTINGKIINYSDDFTLGAGTFASRRQYPEWYNSLEAVRASRSRHNWIYVASANEGQEAGAMWLYFTGTTGGTPTATGARFTALAANEIINAGGYGYALMLNQDITPYTFGFAEAADETASILNAITYISAQNVKLYWPEATYYSDPIRVPSNSWWVCSPKAILSATSGYDTTDKLLDFDGASNVVFECNYAQFKMIKADYSTGEHRHVFNLINCTNVTLLNPNGLDSGGDIYYINGATNLTMTNPKGDNARRNTCSVIKATDLTVTGIAKFSDSTGTAPQAGLVIEPNADTDSLIRVNFETVEITGMVSDACNIYLDDYKTGTPADVSISIGKIISRGNGGRALRVSNVFLNSGSYGGLIEVGSIESSGDAKNALSVVDKSSAAPFLRIGSITAINPCTGASSFVDTSAIYIGDTSAATTGGIHVGKVSVAATHTDMDYAVILEMGAGLTDIRVDLDNVKGYQTTPVRMNNITSTIAEASDVIVNFNKIRDTLAITSGTNIMATTHLGRIITNSGAPGSVTAAVREYPPAGNPYRFRVETAQVLAVDPFDATDRITGTTAAGASVQSNVVGAECEIYFIGTIGGVRYWRLDPLGNPASWTFN